MDTTKKIRGRLIFSILITLLINMACTSSIVPTATPTPSFTPSPIPSPTLTATPTSIPKHNVGDVIESTNYVFIILGWEFVSGDDAPAEGKKYIAVDMLLVNKQKLPEEIKIAEMVRLVDDTGQRYLISEDATYAAKGAGIYGINVDGELAAGDKVRGKVGFQVPENSSGLQLDFTVQSDWSIPSVILGSEPVTVEPPSEIPGVIPQEAYKIGEEIDIKNATFTINTVSHNSGDDFGQPDPTTKYLAVEMTLSNKSAETIFFMSLFQIALKCSSGREYDVDLTGPLTTIPEMEIAPGQFSRGWVVFRVAEEETGYFFILYWGNRTILIEIS